MLTSEIIVPANTTATCLNHQVSTSIVVTEEKISSNVQNNLPQLVIFLERNTDRWKFISMYYQFNSRRFSFTYIT